MKNITYLALGDNPITEEGLAYLKELPKLEDLELRGLRIGEVGLDHLAKLRNLRYLRLYYLKVDQVAKLHKALPHCKIEWDGGVVEAIASTNADRQAAEWVLGQKVNHVATGIVSRTDVPFTALEVADLPKEPFRLVSLGWPNHTPTKNVNEEFGQLLASLPKLETVQFYGSDADDAFLKAVSKSRTLKHLHVSGANVSGGQITDEGIVHLRELRTLRSLNLNLSPVTNVSLAALAELSALEELIVFGTRCTNNGVESLKALKKLRHLEIGSPYLTDSALETISTLSSLEELALTYGGSYTDEGVAKLAALVNLRSLHIEEGLTGESYVALATLPNLVELRLKNWGNSHKVENLPALEKCPKLENLSLDFRDKVAGDVVPYLAKLQRLKLLDLRHTNFSEETCQQLHKALPKCKIKWNGGVVEPETESAALDREIAAWVLSLNGRVAIETGENPPKTITDVKELPIQSFRLTLVDLQNNYKVKKQPKPGYQTAVKDDDLAKLNGLENLTTLNLAYAGITDAGLAHLANLKNLESLDLHFTQLRGPGLEHLTRLKNLSTLNLGGTHVTGAGFAHLKELTSLKTLHLGQKPTQFSDADMLHLASLQNLTRLHLNQTKVSDEGLGHLNQLKNLERLDLKESQVTATGIKKLHQTLPNCKIEWDGGVVGPAEPMDSDRKATE